MKTGMHYYCLTEIQSLHSQALVLPPEGRRLNDLPLDLAWVKQKQRSEIEDSDFKVKCVIFIGLYHINTEWYKDSNYDK